MDYKDRPKREYVYDAFVKRVVDGDTIVCDIDLGLHFMSRGESLRLYGVDTPELRPRRSNFPNEEERQEEIKNAKIAKEDLKHLIEGKWVRIKSHLPEKDLIKGARGRYIIEIWIDDLYINKYLLDKGLAEEKYY